MTLTRITQLSILLCLISFNLSAQTKENAEITQMLTGQWIFIKTVDADSNEVKYVTKDYKGPDGAEIQVVANGPDITIRADHTFIKKFTATNSDKGNWKLLSDNEIEYEMVIPTDSRQGNLIRQTQELFGKKWRTDANGNYLDASTDKIILLTANEMRVQYEKKYVLIYRKNKL